tara:strand:+ start:57 stop:242 length:186 start_codon:yes stop_codon:yes gene_type:complete
MVRGVGLGKHEKNGPNRAGDPRETFGLSKIYAILTRLCSIPATNGFMQRRNSNPIDAWHRR